MTEEEWLNATDPWPLQQFWSEGGRGRDRKWRLFAVACCRSVLAYGDHSLDALVPVNEAFADGLITEPEFLRRRGEAIRASPRPADVIAECVWSAVSGETASWYNRSMTSQAAYVSDSAVGAVLPEPLHEVATQEELERHPEAKAYFDERSYQARLIRDIFGNPFRPAAFNPAWQTSTVVSLARQMYETRDFGPMPILADALQDAGCGDEGILAHCREPGPHVRGCWAVDLVLGKS